MTRPRRWTLPNLLAVTACSLLAPTACNHTSEPASSANAAPSAPGDGAPAKSAEAAPVLVRRTISVEVDHLLSGTTRIEREDDGKLALIDGLFDALGGERDPKASGATLSTKAPEAYDLHVAGAAPLLWLKSAFQTAAFAGFRPAMLKLEKGTLLLDAAIPGPPTVDPVPREPTYFPDPVLIVTVSAASTRLWRAKLATSGDEAPPGAERVATLAAGDTSGQLDAAFAEQCAKHPCSPGALYTENGLPFSRLEPVLAAYAGAAAQQGGKDPVLVFNVVVPPERPIAPRPPAVVKGRLDPKVIQSRVRAEFDHFRRCYEAGLDKDPKLTGRIEVRFVIGRDGAVANIALKEDTLPSAVSDCIVSEFKKITFPTPEGGIVTVTYPIQFSPE